MIFVRPELRALLDKKKKGKTEEKPKEKPGSKLPLLGDGQPVSDTAETRVQENLEIPAAAKRTDQMEAQPEPDEKAEPDSGEPDVDDLFGNMLGEVPPSQEPEPEEAPQTSAESSQEREPLHAVHPPPPEPEAEEAEPEPEEKQPDVSAIVDAVLERLKTDLGPLLESLVQPLKTEVDQLKAQLGGLATKAYVDKTEANLQTVFDGEIRGILGMEKMSEDAEAADVFPQRVKQLAAESVKTGVAAQLKPVAQDVAALKLQVNGDGTDKKPGLAAELEAADEFMGILHGTLETIAGPNYEAAEGLAAFRTEATMRLLVQTLANKDSGAVRTKVVKIAEQYGKETVAQLLKDFVENPQIVVQELARIQNVTVAQLNSPQDARTAKVKDKVEAATPVILENAKSLIGGSA